MRFVDALADLFLGSECAGCGSPGVALCRCCAHHLLDGDPRRLDRLPGYAAHTFGGAVRGLLVAYKERGVWSLARPLGRALGRAVLPVIADARRTGHRCRNVALLPAPSRAAVVRQRGLDTTQRLAEVAASIARAEGVAVGVVKALRFSRSVSDQSGLGADDRRRNVDGSMRVVRPGGGRAAIVVDDISTSGATLHEAVGAATEAGWVVLGAAVVAVTPAPSGSPPRGP